MAYCTECGSKLAEGAKFCTECGTPVPKSAEGERHVGEPASEKPAAPAWESVAHTAHEVTDALSHMIEAPNTPGEFVVGTWNDGPLEDIRGAGAAALSSGRRKGARSVGASSRTNKGTSHSSPDGGRGRSKLPAIVGVLAVAAIAVVLVLYVVPRFVSHPHDPHEDEVYTPPVEREKKDDASVEKDEPAGQSEPTSTEPGKTNDPGNEVQPQPQTTTEPEQRVEPEPTPPAEPEPGPSVSYNTSETPVIGEFTSWFSNDLMNGNAPAFIARITDLEAVTGGWKAYIYNYAMAGNEYSQPTEELLNVFVDGGQSNLVLTFDWYYTRLGDGEVFENFDPDSTFEGSWEGGTIEALGAGSVRLTDFWEQDGHQYAIGRITWPDAVDGTIALVRP